MNLSKNFTLQEFEKTSVRLDNKLPAIYVNRAKRLFEKVVQPVRDRFGVTIINSGYRSGSVNAAVGGSKSSQHLTGEAVDLEVPGVPNGIVAQWIRDNLEFDQLILEFYTPGVPDSGWVHVSYSDNNRKQVITAKRVNGKTIYVTGLEI